MAACKDLLLQAVQQTVTKVNDGFKIKPKQLEAIKNIVEKKDTLAILPTSYGKSLIYQMLPSVCTTLDLALNPFVIVISPLKKFNSRPNICCFKFKMHWFVTFFFIKHKSWRTYCW